MTNTLEQQRSERLLDAYGEAKRQEQEYRSRLTEINAQIRAARSPQDRHELRRSKRTLKTNLAIAQERCRELKPKARQASRSVQDFFVDLIRRDFLPPDVFAQVWREAEQLKDDSIVNGHHQNSEGRLK